MWTRLKNSPHTYAHEGLESIFLFEFIELQWVQTDFLRLSDNNNCISLPKQNPKSNCLSKKKGNKNAQNSQSCIVKQSMSRCKTDYLAL